MRTQMIILILKCYKQDRSAQTEPEKVSKTFYNENLI